MFLNKKYVSLTPIYLFQPLATFFLQTSHVQCITYTINYMYNKLHVQYITCTINYMYNKLHVQ